MTWQAWYLVLLARRESEYRTWCAEHGEDPETGVASRAYEEYLAGMPIEEWWAEQYTEAQEQARMELGDGGARL